MPSVVGRSVRLWCVVLALSAVGAMASTGTAADLFPDKNLEAVVRQEVFEKRDNNKPLEEKDVQNLSRIKGRGKKIKDLRGLEKCTSLAELDLADNEIADLAPIKDLTNLQSVTLRKNKITDVKPLAGLKGLQYLQLAENQITDVGPLAQLAAMRSLYLDFNQIKDVGPLVGLNQMWSLYLRGNKVTDLKPLAKKELTSLDLRGNEVTDLAPLDGMTELRYLMLDKNKVADLAVLVKMAKADDAGQKRFAPFWRIYLHGNPLGDAAKGQMEELTKLGARVSLEETK